MTKGLYYFAHPYTVKDPAGNYVLAGEEANFRLCCMRSAQLLQRGYNIYSPIAHSHPIHTHCPEFLAKHEHEIWYELDNEFIKKTRWDGIIMAPDWETSKGCVAERNLFEEMGIPIYEYGEIVW